MVPSLQAPQGGPASAICLSPPLRSSLPLALSTPSTLLTRDTAPGGYNASIAAVVQSTKLSAEVIAVETALLPRIKGCGGRTDQLSGRRVIDRCRKKCAQANLQCRQCSAPLQQVVFTRDGSRCRTILLQCVQGYGGPADQVSGRRVIAAGTILLQRIESCRRSIDQVFGCRGIGAQAIDAGKPPTIHGGSAATCGNRGLELAAETFVL